MTNHWADLLRNPHPLGSFYSTIPPLKSVRLRSFHIDWRGPALTTRIDFPEYPEYAPPEWSTLGHNTLQAHLQFAAVDDLTVHGWIPSTFVDIDISFLNDWTIQTNISGAGLEIQFNCSNSLTIGHISSFQATESGSDEVPHSFLHPIDARRFSSIPDTHVSNFYDR
ncbi:Imm50 family immunity protein [Streptomyces sp. SH5]|uniref:Imm50 family immunity protein n=1 Tax=Streptomyces sp. SH5 TaxID=3041765 RepID=UPI00247802FF|nr:Imm50 family immunity protein [Streptomyces sp. SH5]WGP09838.1 Imm50 family immunity protein [Streptomyces sp. SH5]